MKGNAVYFSGFAGCKDKSRFEDMFEGIGFFSKVPKWVCRYER